MATISELNSYNLADAVRFHDDLNPKLWKNDQLDPLVKKQLLIIAEDFVEELGISDLDIVDVTISGSNAAFSWTPHSDLDLHILVNMSEMHDDEVYRELFRAKKTLYNDTHDITVHGIPVELYVQDASESVVSLGEYSILNDKWIKIPKKKAATIDQNATKAKYEQLADLISLAVKTKDIDRVNKTLKLIKRYRQSGLDKGGEFSPENLAFKMIRTQGGISDLYAIRDKLHSNQLSIEEDSPVVPTPEKNDEFHDEWKRFKEDYDPNGPPPGPEFKPTMPAGTVRVDVSDVYDWYKLGKNISNLGQVDPSIFGKGPPSTIMAFGTEPEEHKYIKNLKKLGLTTTDIDPKDPKQPKGVPRQSVDPTYNVNETRRSHLPGGFPKLPTWNQYVNERAWKPYYDQVNRYLRENNLYSSALFGRILDEGLRRLDDKRVLGEGVEFEPASTKSIMPILSYIQSHAIMLSELNSMQTADLVFVREINYAKQLDIEIEYQVTIESVNNNDILVKHRDGKREEINIFPLSDMMVKRGTYVIMDDASAIITAMLFHINQAEEAGWHVDVSNINAPTSEINEASGYLPSAKEKNDPRFKTALTVDVHPDTIKKNAKAFGFKTSRAGIPPQARADGKITENKRNIVNSLLTEYTKNKTVTSGELVSNLAKVLGDWKSAMLVMEKIHEDHGDTFLMENVIDESIKRSLQIMVDHYSISNPILGNEYIPVMLLMTGTSVMFFDVLAHNPAASPATFGTLEYISNDYVILSMSGDKIKYPNDQSTKLSYSTVMLIDSVEKYNRLRTEVMMKYEQSLPSFADDVNESLMNEWKAFLAEDEQQELFPGYDEQHREKRLSDWLAKTWGWTGKKPQVFYHATTKNFDTFNTHGTGFSSALGMAFEVERHGSFFAVDPKFAEEFIEDPARPGQYKDGGRVLPVYLSIQNPIDLRDDALSRMISDESTVEEFKANDIDLWSIYQHFNQLDRWELFDDVEGAELVANLQKLGFDGAIIVERVNNANSGEVWVAFSPTQIKAIHNRGSFSPTDSSMMKESADNFFTLTPDIISQIEE